MDKESVERLRFDSRLSTRSGWVDATMRESYLEALPDVSDKMTTCGDEDDALEAATEAASAASPPPTPDLQPEAAAPLADDFSTPFSADASPPTSPEPSVQSSIPPSTPTPHDQGSAGTFPGESSRGAGSFDSESESN
jgi:hypothetical protein